MHLNEYAIAHMKAEWQELQVTRVAGWEEQALAMEAEQAHLIRSGAWLGGPVDLLSVIGKARWETFHSALLAWLLWPTARHGLGSAMLERFLKRCWPGSTYDPDLLMRCTTSTEVSRPNSRADIVVDGPGLKLVIEVKVDATEGPAQCERLHQDHVEDGALFAFLTPRGRPPTSAGDDISDWATVSFTAVREDLEHALAMACQDGAAVTTARSYLTTLTKEFR